MQGARSAVATMYKGAHEDSGHRATQQSERAGSFWSAPRPSKCRQRGVHSRSRRQRSHRLLQGGSLVGLCEFWLQLLGAVWEVSAWPKQRIHDARRVDCLRRAAIALARLRERASLSAPESRGGEAPTRALSAPEQWQLAASGATWSARSAASRAPRRSSWTRGIERFEVLEISRPPDVRRERPPALRPPHHALNQSSKPSAKIRAGSSS
jgi:hypothetical protein